MGRGLRGFRAGLRNPRHPPADGSRPPDGRRVARQALHLVLRFWSQGDGACFEGYWSHAKGAAARIRDYAPTDATLHGIIADRLQAIQRRNFYQLAAEVSHRGRYYHEYTMSIDVTRDSPTWQPPAEDAEEVVTEALRDLARWLYRQLEAEYDHFTSDEAIEEGIILNEYTFTEAGRRFG